MPSSCIRIISNTSLLLETIRDSNTQTPYDFIYISYGSKVNEHHVQLENSLVLTNSHLQIIPNFLQVRGKNVKILSISIDDYSTRGHRDSAIQRLEPYIDDSNVEIILLDNSDIDIQEITRVLIQFLNEIGMNPKNTMFCNYIRFICPNPHESKLENAIPNIIYDTICQESNETYSECFYQWYGYNSYTYNLIFQYSIHRSIDIMYSRLLAIFISNFGRKCMLSIDEFTHLVELHNLNVRTPLKLFLTCSVDITSFWKHNDKMKETIYELGQDQDQDQGRDTQCEYA